MICLLEVITTFIILTTVWSGMHLIGYNYPVILIFIYFLCELPPSLLYPLYPFKSI